MRQLGRLRVQPIHRSAPTARGLDTVGLGRSENMPRDLLCSPPQPARLNRVSLIADKIGHRPIYYWIEPTFVVFSTALRVFEELDEVPKEMDLRGVTEIACFGLPLADRTAYIGISTLMAGQVVHVSAKTVAKKEYWRWDRLPPSNAETSELSTEAIADLCRVLSAVLGRNRPKWRS